MHLFTGLASTLSTPGVIGDLGMKAVVIDDVLTATGVLTKLHLRGCHLKSEAFEAIGVGLANCFTLKELRCLSTSFFIPITTTTTFSSSLCTFLCLSLSLSSLLSFSHAQCGLAVSWAAVDRPRCVIVWCRAQLELESDVGPRPRQRNHGRSQGDSHHPPRHRLLRREHQRRHCARHAHREAPQSITTVRLRRPVSPPYGHHGLRRRRGHHACTVHPEGEVDVAKVLVFRLRVNNQSFDQFIVPCCAGST
jgi:hypothetical protein